jgi:phosphatidylglycerophosphate synthase
MVAPGAAGGPVRRPDVLRDVALAAPVAVTASGPTWWLLGWPASFAVAVASLYAALAVIVVRGLPSDAPGPGVGAANRVTLLRASLSIPIGALALFAVALDDASAWWVIVLGTAAMVLDGVDGRVARRTGTQNAFGARFDMELDAGLILALSVLVWASGRAGLWVLAIGLMRYLFVVASWLVPSLGGALPERFRRKAVCVVQGVVLLVALGPIIPGPVAAFVCAFGLAALTWSFAVDVVWLLRTAD